MAIIGATEVSITLQPKPGGKHALSVWLPDAIISALTAFHAN
jgi:hypothetical protein